MMPSTLTYTASKDDRSGAAEDESTAAGLRHGRVRKRSTACQLEYSVELGYWRRRPFRHPVYAIFGRKDTISFMVARQRLHKRFVDDDFPGNAGTYDVPFEQIELARNLECLTQREVVTYCRIRRDQRINGELPEDKDANEANALIQARTICSQTDTTSAHEKDSFTRHLSHQVQRRYGTDDLNRSLGGSAPQSATRSSTAAALTFDPVRAAALQQAEAETDSHAKAVAAAYTLATLAAAATAAIPRITVHDEIVVHGTTYTHQADGPFAGCFVSPRQVITHEEECYERRVVLTKVASDGCPARCR